MNWLSKEIVLYKGQGQYSAVKVTRKGNRVNLYTGDNFLQSPLNLRKVPVGAVYDWYLVAPWFAGNFTGQINSLLILGLGAGVQVKLYNKTYQVKDIVGVEIDPLIADLGKKYFGLDDHNLQIIIDDASHYIKNVTARFDVIILDAYKGNKYDVTSGSREMLRDIVHKLTSRGVLVINRVFGDATNASLEKDLTSLFTTVFIFKVHKNVFYIGTNSKEAPKTVEDVKNILKSAVKINKELSFFKTFKLSNLRILT